MKPHTTLLLSLLLLTRATLLHAESPTNAGNASAGSETGNWYQVEVLIFAQQSALARRDTSDNTLAKEVRSYPTNPVDLSLPDTPFPLVPKTQLLLGPEAYTLDHSNNYQVLYHQAWKQPGLSHKNSRWVKISGSKGQEDLVQFEGILRIYLSRYFHVNTRLWRSVERTISPQTESPAMDSDPTKMLDQSATSDAAGMFTQSTTIQSAPNSKATENISTDVYVLRESRKLTLGELHYLDNPNLGMLIKITRAQP